MITSNIDKVRTDTKVVVECDFRVSSKCKGSYLKLYKNILIGRRNNNGQDRCKNCFNTATKSGKDNPNFKYSKNEDFFSDIDSELKAYLLGWIAGDGCLKQDGLYLTTHVKDIEILYLFQNILGCDQVISLRERDKTANIKFHSVKLVKDLCKHLQVPTGKKSHKIIIPELQTELVWPFLRGLFDSDGSLPRIDSKHTSPSCNISSKSDIIRNQIYEFCIRNGIDCCISQTMVHFWGRNSLNFLSKLYDNSNFALCRKKELYIKWSSWIPYKGTHDRPRT